MTATRSYGQIKISDGLTPHWEDALERIFEKSTHEIKCHTLGTTCRQNAKKRFVILHAKWMKKSVQDLSSLGGHPGAWHHFDRHEHNMPNHLNTTVRANLPIPTNPFHTPCGQKMFGSKMILRTDQIHFAHPSKMFNCLFYSILVKIVTPFSHNFLKDL